MHVVDLTAAPPPVEWGVEVDIDAIEALARRWSETAMPLPQFDYPGTPERRDESTWYTYVTMAVSVLACLWPPDGEQMWATEHHGVWLDDAPGVFAAFTRKLTSDGTLDLHDFAGLTDAAGVELFAGRGCLQMLPERIETLRGVAHTLLERWDGNARNLIAEAGSDAGRVATILTESMPGYRDRPRSEQGVLPFDKLAHLATSIMSAGAGWNFDGIDDFPLYPDYMLPRVMRFHGVFQYAPELAEAIDNRRLITADSHAEHAIRWATVYAGDQLRTALAVHGNPVTGPELDYHLWSHAVLGPDAAHLGEHHRTLTLRY